MNVPLDDGGFKISRVDDNHVGHGGRGGFAEKAILGGGIFEMAFIVRRQIVNENVRERRQETKNKYGTRPPAAAIRARSVIS